jgi:protein tyrosine/serine phosphatase
MRTGIFYRSEALSTLTNADWATLSKLHIGLDIDLRTPSEIAGPASLPLSPNAGPDRVPNGAAYTNVNIYGTTDPLPTNKVNSPTAAVAYMTTTYQGFVADPIQRAALHTVLIDLVNEPSAALFHCSGGKDRTGWTAMLLQSIAGVSPTTIMNDYLASNSYMAGSINQILANIPAIDQPTFKVMLGVQSSFLQAGFDQVIASYGSLNAYLTQGLGLTQADIYVLRAKMVYYQTLPGQSGFTGNAASGAALLNALQNSPLSGHYTAYNYYLQSAVDAGTLGGVQTQVGGQVNADAASYLLRQPLLIDQVITPYTNGGDLREGQTRVWLAGLGGNFASDGHSGIAGSTENSAGSLFGATYRMNNHASANLGIGYNWGSVGSADATATINTVLATIGGRYGFSALEAGPFVEARADAGWVDYQSRRALGAGLGTPTGNTNGAVYSGKVGLGDVIPLAPFTVTLQTGVRLAGVSLGSFKENGSEMALNVHDINKTLTSLFVDLNVSLDRQQLEAWTIAPAVTLGYERVLSNPQAESLGTLYGFAVTQNSAYGSHNLMKTGLGVTAQHDAFNVKAGFNAVVGDGGKSTGLGGQLSIGYSF